MMNFFFSQNQRRVGHYVRKNVLVLLYGYPQFITRTTTTRRSTTTTSPASSTSSAERQERDDKETSQLTNITNTTMTQQQQPSPLHIIGSGSIGLFLAASIRAACPTYPIQLLLRDHHASSIQKYHPGQSSYIDICLQQQQQQQQQRDGGGDDHGQQELQQQQKQGGGGGKNKSVSTPRMMKMIQVPTTLISSTCSESSISKPISTLLVTTKAFQVIEAIQSIQNRIVPDSTQIVVFCNGGLAVRDELIEYYERQQQQRQQLDNDSSDPTKKGQCRRSTPIIQLASLTHGAYRIPTHNVQQEKQQPNDKERQPTHSNNNINNNTNSKDNHNEFYHVVHAGMGQIYVTDSTLVDVLNQSNLYGTLLSQDDMELMLWYKLISNCICNPLTAIHQCTNGTLVQLNQFHTIVHGIIQEICMIYSIQNHGRPKELDYDYAIYFTNKVIQDNFYNYSSMQQDILYQRPTEIKYLNGYIVELSEKYGISCPSNQELWKRICEMEMNYLKSQ